jgi:hypothetical protein
MDTRNDEILFLYIRDATGMVSSSLTTSSVADKNMYSYCIMKLTAWLKVMSAFLK